MDCASNWRRFPASKAFIAACKYINTLFLEQCTLKHDYLQLYKSWIDIYRSYKPGYPPLPLPKLLQVKPCCQPQVQGWGGWWNPGVLPFQKQGAKSFFKAKIYQPDSNKSVLVFKIVKDACFHHQIQRITICHGVSRFSNNFPTNVYKF